MTGQQRNGGGHAHRKWAARVLRNATHCAICGKPLDKTLKAPHPLSPSADHIEPWVVAPHLRYDVRNGQATHLRCNQQRGSKPMSEVAPPPSRDW